MVEQRQRPRSAYRDAIWRDVNAIQWTEKKSDKICSKNIQRTPIDTARLWMHRVKRRKKKAKVALQFCDSLMHTEVQHFHFFSSSYFSAATQNRLSCLFNFFHVVGMQQFLSLSLLIFLRFPLLFLRDRECSGLFIARLWSPLNSTHYTYVSLFFFTFLIRSCTLRTCTKTNSRHCRKHWRHDSGDKWCWSKLERVNHSHR